MYISRINLFKEMFGPEMIVDIRLKYCKTWTFVCRILLLS